jgi:hypothetical protein
MAQGIKVEFDNPEQTIIRWDFRGRWTWDDWDISVRRVMALRQLVNDRPVVPAIINFKYSGALPLGALPHARATGELMDARDYVVIVHASGYMRSMIEAFRLLNPSFRHRILLADTLDDARALIADKAVSSRH